MLIFTFKKKKGIIRSPNLSSHTSQSNGSTQQCMWTFFVSKKLLSSSLAHISFFLFFSFKNYIMDLYSQKIFNFWTISPEWPLTHGWSHVTMTERVSFPRLQKPSWAEQWEKHSVETFHFLERQGKGSFSRQTLGVWGQAELRIPTENCPALWENNGSRVTPFTVQDDVGLIEFLAG